VSITTGTPSRHSGSAATSLGGAGTGDAGRAAVTKEHTGCSRAMRQGLQKVLDIYDPAQ
jgi:hypothetical protein